MKIVENKDFKLIIQKMITKEYKNAVSDIFVLRLRLNNFNTFLEEKNAVRSKINGYNKAYKEVLFFFNKCMSQSEMDMIDGKER